MNERKNVIELVACAPPRCNCPILTMDTDTCTLEIVDDFCGRVTMSFEEFSILARRFLAYV